MKKSWWLIILGAVLISACSSSEPGVQIEQAWIRPDPRMENAAGYLVIRNDGSETDVLTDVSADFSKSAMLHQSMMEGDVHRMEQVSRLEIPPGGAVELQPLGYHVMLIDLKRDLKYGERVAFTLTFEKAGDVRVEAEVRRD